MANQIAQALKGETPYLLIKIEAYALVGKAQEVYPSEELVLDKGKGDKSKILYHVNDVAAIHSQKIGNALRTIDTWYPELDDKKTAIAIEPYGAVTNLGKAYRTPKDKKDFFSLFDKYALGDSLENAEQEHYVMAVLVRVVAIYATSDMRRGWCSVKPSPHIPERSLTHQAPPATSSPPRPRTRARVGHSRCTRPSPRHQK